MSTVPYCAHCSPLIPLPSFLTGSRAYGEPRADSDVDLAVLVTYRELQALLAAADCRDGEYQACTALRFGKLNLLCFVSDAHFRTWRQGTHELIARAPVTRAQAIEHLEAIQPRHGGQTMPAPGGDATAGKSSGGDFPRNVPAPQ